MCNGAFRGSRLTVVLIRYEDSGPHSLEPVERTSRCSHHSLDRRQWRRHPRGVDRLRARYQGISARECYFDAHRSKDSTLERVQNRIPETPFHLFAPLGDNARSVSPRLFWWLFKNIKTYDVVHIHTLLHPISTVCALIARLRNVPRTSPCRTTPSMAKTPWPNAPT